MIDFSGNSRYWALAGYDLRLPYKDNEANFIVPSVELAIPPNVDEITYVEAYEKVFFLKKNISNVIYSQYFPHAKAYKGYNNSLIKLAKDKLRLDKLEQYESDYSILKLKSTKKNLYALQKADNKFYISKISIFENGFNDREDVKEVVIPFPGSIESIDQDDISIEIFDINDFEADIYILSKKMKTIYISKFRSSKEKCVFSQNLDVLTNEHFLPTSFCKYDKGIIIMDEDRKAFCFLEAKKNRFVKRETVLFEETVKGIKFFSVDFENIVCDLTGEYNKIDTDVTQIDVVLIFNENKIWYFNCFTKKMELLFGDGTTHIRNAPNEKKNLKEYRLIEIKDITPISNNCIFFKEEAENSYKYSLLTPRIRSLYMLGNIPIKNTESTTYDIS